MTARQTDTFHPDYVVIPGTTLAETLGRLGMTQIQFSEQTGLTCKTIDGIINGSETITPDIANQLENVFHVPARFWINLQKIFEKANGGKGKSEFCLRRRK